MDLLLIVSGKKSEIIKINNLDNNIKSIKIDEKDLSNFKFINNIIKSNKPNQLYFSVYSLDYLRFSFFMKMFFFINGLSGGIIDQFGSSIGYKTLSFIILEIPKFILEALFSVIVIIYYKIVFTFKSEQI